MNHPTREILINCGMVPVSAVSMDGSVTRGYWHPLSCAAGECYVAGNKNSYFLKSFPIVHNDAGAEYLKYRKIEKAGVIL